MINEFSKSHTTNILLSKALATGQMRSFLIINSFAFHGVARAISFFQNLVSLQHESLCKGLIINRSGEP